MSQTSAIILVLAAGASCILAISVYEWASRKLHKTYSR